MKSTVSPLPQSYWPKSTWAFSPGGGVSMTSYLRRLSGACSMAPVLSRWWMKLRRVCSLPGSAGYLPLSTNTSTRTS